MDDKEKRIIKNMIRDRAMNAEEYKKTAEKNMKTNAENRYRQNQLHDITKAYVSLAIRKKLKNCHSKEEMVSYLSDEKNMKSIYGRVCLDIAIKDKKAEKEGGLLINKNKVDLSKTFERFYYDVASEVVAEIIEENKNKEVDGEDR